VNPLLAPLAANGGPTLTHAIGATSPARDAADLATCLATDQRNVVRPQGSGCDIGAFELEPAVLGPPVTPGTPSPAADLISPHTKVKFGAQTLRRALARGLSARVGTDEAGLATMRVYVDGANARRVLGRPAVVLRVAKGSHRFKRAGSAKVVARFTAKAKKALKTRSRVRFRVRIAVTDKAGNTKLTRRRVTLRTPR
jgi:hypothetical protein